jgi:hypothetical protein
MQPEEVEMNNFSKRVNLVRVCGATLLAAFAATAFGHDDDWNRTDKPLVWVDSKGKTIGRAAGTNHVQLKVDRLSLIVPIGNDVCTSPFSCNTSLEVGWGAGGFLTIVFFKALDCGGKEAYVTAPVPGSDRAVGIIGKTLYIGSDVKNPSLVSIQSEFAFGSCSNTRDPQGVPTPRDVSAWNVVMTRNLDRYGTKPFSLK